jgi:alpha-glucosidase
LAENHVACNVASARTNPCSLYNLYRRLIALRRAHKALQTGVYRPSEVRGDVLAFTRESGRERIYVALNFGAAPVSAALPPGGRGKIVASTLLDRDGTSAEGQVDLRSNEGLVVKLD